MGWPIGEDQDGWGSRRALVGQDNCAGCRGQRASEDVRFIFLNYAKRILRFLSIKERGKLSNWDLISGLARRPSVRRFAKVGDDRPTSCSPRSQHPTSVGWPFMVSSSPLNDDFFCVISSFPGHLICDTSLVVVGWMLMKWRRQSK